MKRLPKKITNEIREILEGCRDGRLEHKQDDWTCGTAHCVAGWKVVLDRESIIGDRVHDIWELNEFVEHAMGDAYANCGSYARDKWELTVNEGDELFNGEATLPDQFALLEKLERGERVQ